MKARGSLTALALAAACFACAAPVSAAPDDLVQGVLASPAAPFHYQRATGLESAVLAEINRTRMQAGLYYGARRWRYWAVGENLLWATDAEPTEVVSSWLQSPTHRVNLMSRRWREVGLGAISVPTAAGIYGGSDVTILTADFGFRR